MTRVLIVIVRRPVRWYRRDTPELQPPREPAPTSARPLTHHLDFDLLLR